MYLILGCNAKQLKNKQYTSGRIVFIGNYADAIKAFAELTPNEITKYIVVKTEVVTDWK